MPVIVGMGNGHRAALSNRERPSIDMLDSAYVGRGFDQTSILGAIRLHSDGVSEGGADTGGTDRAYLAQFSPEQRQLIKILRESQEPMQRLDAINRLAKPTDPHQNNLLIPEFVRALKDENEKVRSAALSSFGFPPSFLVTQAGIGLNVQLEAVRALIDAMGDPSEHVRKVAVRNLRVVTVVRPDLISDAERVRSEFLRVWNNPQEDVAVRAQAARGYGTLIDAGGLDKIEELSKSKVGIDVAFAAYALGSFLAADGDRREPLPPQTEEWGYELLIMLLQHESGAVRTAALHSLGMRVLPHMERFFDLSHDDVPDVRWELVIILYSEGSAAEVAPLLMLLCDPIDEIHDLAGEKLENLLQESAEGLFDPAPEVRHRAVRRLEEFFSQSWGAIRVAETAALFDWREQDHPRHIGENPSIGESETELQRLVAIRLASSFKRGGRLEHFRSCKQRWTEIVSAVLASRGLEGARALLKYESPSFRCAVIECLESIHGAEEATQELLPLLFTDDKRVTRQVLEFLSANRAAAKLAEKVLPLFRDGSSSIEASLASAALDLLKDGSEEEQS
jgi:HEAT repeat protein